MNSLGFGGVSGQGKLLLALILATSGATSTAAGQAVAAPKPLSGDTERETFLLEGEVVRDRPAPGGITLPRRVTLRFGNDEHDALVQTHDEYRSRGLTGKGVEIDFRDSWRHNVAAYRVDRLLGLGFVPVTVVRNYRQGPAAWTWWVDDVLMSDRERYESKTRPAKPLAWVCQKDVVRVFDQLIYNFDRTLENLLIDEDWQLWMIDHTRSFKIFEDLENESDLPARCEKGLLAGLKGLERPMLREAMVDLLNEKQIDGLLARRDAIVRYYEGAIEARGEAAVLYELPPRVVSTAEPR